LSRAFADSEGTMPAFHDLDPAAEASVADILSELDLRPEYDNGPLGEGAAEDSTTSALGGARSEYSTKSAEDTSVNASAPATITKFTSDDKTLSKHYELGADGSGDPLAIPEAEREAAKRMSKDMVDLCKLDWPLVILSPYDPALVARAQLPDADRETKRRANASGKAPFGNDWQNKATSNWNDLKGWARDALDHFGRCPNLGVLAGAYIPPKDGRPGGYLLPVDLDVKGPDGKPVTTRGARRAELEAKIGAALPETVSDDSPSGGGHDWFFEP
jgi:Bifunctional DNA primase/polymerase, N-terminal